MCGQFEDREERGDKATSDDGSSQCDASIVAGGAKESWLRDSTQVNDAILLYWL